MGIEPIPLPWQGNILTIKLYRELVGRGRICTYDVSYVTDLQSVALAS